MPIYYCSTNLINSPVLLEEIYWYYKLLLKKSIVIIMLQIVIAFEILCSGCIGKSMCRYGKNNGGPATS